MGTSDTPAPIGVRKALLITFSERLFSILAMFLVTAITARLMTPADFAIVAIGIAVNLVVQTVQDFGISNYLVQKKELSSDDVRTGFTIVALISTLIAILLVLVAGPLERFVGLPGLAPFMRVLALAALITPVIVPPIALIRREQQFDRLALFNLGNSTTNAFVLVILAALGFGHMSFVYALLAAGLVSAVLAGRLGFAAGAYRLRLSDWRSAIHFGFWSASIETMARMQELTVSLVLGKGLRPDQLGMFNRASYLATIPPKLMMAGIGPIAMSRFAAAGRAGADLPSLYLRVLAQLTGVVWPMLLVLALLAEPVTLLMLGREWHGAVGMVAILALAQIFAPPGMIAFFVLSARDTLRPLALVNAGYVVLMALVLAFATRFGPIVAAWAIVGLTMVHGLATHLLCQRSLGFAHRECLKRLLPSLVITLAALLGPCAVVAMRGFRLDFSLLSAAGVAILACVGWLAGLAASGHPLGQDLLAGWRAARARLPAAWSLAGGLKPRSSG